MRAIELLPNQVAVTQYALQQIHNEKARRHLLALEASQLGYGGISAVARAYGVSRSMIHSGLREIEKDGLFTGGRQRKEGAGRPTFGSMFAKHMAEELNKGEYLYVRRSDLIFSEELSNQQKSFTDMESDQHVISSEKTSHDSDRTPESSKHEDAQNPKCGKKHRGLDIERIIKDNTFHSRENAHCILLPENPYSVESWIEQIIYEQFAAIYGDPASPHMYVNLTLDEIRERFEDRTHASIARTTLWEIMRNMGFSLQKNMKYEQAGKPHPQRDEQFIYIQSLIDDYKRSGDVILSIDSKAAIKLGCFLSNGRVWCPQQQPPHVLDHDFAFLFEEIYPHGSELIPCHMMKKRAIVKPSGVYDVIHNLAHVTIGISHDTSEFAGVSLINAWNTVKSLYPNAKRSLILSDGGGSNRVAGVLWKSEIANFHNVSGLPVMVCHYPPGCSKYDPIEHRVWSMISKNWQGSPLLDIERVMYFMESTSTKTGLRVTCELDTNEYLTEAQKRVAGSTPISKKAFEKRINITYPNPNGALATWNYLIDN